MVCHKCGMTLPATGSVCPYCNTERSYEVYIYLFLAVAFLYPVCLVYQAVTGESKEAKEARLEKEEQQKREHTEKYFPDKKYNDALTNSLWPKTEAQIVAAYGKPKRVENESGTGKNKTAYWIYDNLEKYANLPHSKELKGREASLFMLDGHVVLVTLKPK